jgi:sugar phosphate permease
MGTFCLVVSAVFDLQILSGVVQSTGWPGVVTVIGNWFGRTKRGTQRCYVEVTGVDGIHFICEQMTLCGCLVVL